MNGALPGDPAALLPATTTESGVPAGDLEGATGVLVAQQHLPRSVENDRNRGEQKNFRPVRFALAEQKNPGQFVLAGVLSCPFDAAAKRRSAWSKLAVPIALRKAPAGANARIRTPNHRSGNKRIGPRWECLPPEQMPSGKQQSAWGPGQRGGRFLPK